MEETQEAVVSEDQLQQETESCTYDDDDSSSDISGYDELNDLDCYGIEAIDRACLLLYPDQKFPVKTEAVVKFWWVLN